MARSRTPADLGGLCHWCWRRLANCLCAEIPRVNNRTEVLVLRHAKEGWSTSNTVRIASLALERCEVLEVGVLDDRENFDKKFAEILADGRNNYLLFPGSKRQIVREGEMRLIVPDGNWRQARRMMLRVPGLATMPRISLTAEETTITERLRRPPSPDALSTIEAIARALGMLEGEELARPLLDIYRTMVARS